jgi:hypothetical protein
MDIDVAAGTISLLTPVVAANIRIIQGGDLYLSPDIHRLID